MGITAEQLVSEATSKFRNTSSWYDFNQEIMQATDHGRLMFMWEAVDSSKNIFRQYDEVNFLRGLTDPNFLPDINTIISTRGLNPLTVRQFSLFPIAWLRSRCPWFQREYRVVLRTGERFIFCWETDQQKPSGRTIRRTAIGIDAGIAGNTFFVISPSGVMVLSRTLNVSYEGE